MACVQLTDKLVEELNKALGSKLTKGLKSLGLNTEYKNSKLTKEEAIAVFSEYATTNGITAEKLDEMFTVGNYKTILELIYKGRDKKIAEDKLAALKKEEEKKEKLKFFKLGGAELDVFDLNATRGKKKVNDKATAPLNTDTLFVFSGNLQAVNATNEEQIGNTIEVKTGVHLNTKEGPSMMRTNTNGDINDNAIELVLTKNQQNAEGRFLTENFQDNEDDFNAFMKANKRAIDRIKSLIDAQEGTYKKIKFPNELLTGELQLPQRFIEALQKMLDEELGLQTMMVSRPNGNLGLHVVKLDRNQFKLTTKDLTEKTLKLNEALASLQANLPTLSPVTVDPEDRYILSIAYPKVEDRLSRINYISNFFSQILSDTIDLTVLKLLSFKDLGIISPELEVKLEGLTSGNSKDLKIFFIKNFGNSAFIQSVIESMKSFIDKWALADDFINAKDDSEYSKEAREAYNEIYDYLLGKSEEAKEFGLYKNFADMMAQRGITSEEKIKQAAATLAAVIAHSFKVMSDEKVFKALMSEASSTIAFNEDIRFSFENDVISLTNNEELEDSNMQEEEKESANREGYMIEYKMVDPVKTMSLNIKTLLGSLFKRDAKTGGYIYDDLCLPVKMNPLIAYEILLENFAKMKNPDDFVRVLDETIAMYPWLQEIRDKLLYNPLNPKAYMGLDIRNEFFSCVRKTKVPYAMLTARGLIKYLSSDTSSVAIIRNVKNNIEGGLVLGGLSIYDDYGRLRWDNINTLNALFVTTTPTKDSLDKDKLTNDRQHNNRLAFYTHRRRSPAGWCKNVLLLYVNGKGKAVDVILAIRLLSDNNARYSLESLLKDVGINTNEINVDTLFGNLNFFLNADVSVDEKELQESTHISMKEILEVLPIENARNIINVLLGVDTIINKEKLKSLTSTSLLVNKQLAAYLLIGRSISQSSEGFSGMTFRVNDKTMATYAAPDFISDLIANINNMNREEADAYIEENYGQYDFFRDPTTKKWLNKWLENFFYENKDPNTEAERFPFRRNFKYLNVLSLLGSAKENTVLSIDKLSLKKGIIYAFYAANDSADKLMAFYRIPSLSDVDALVMLLGEAYKGKNYQELILDLLVGVVRQEYDRISKNETEEGGVVVENYNEGKNNASKFNYLTFLNKPKFAQRIREILEIDTKNAETNTEYNLRVNEEIKELIRETIANKALNFIDSFSDSEKLSMYSTLSGKTLEQQLQEDGSLASEENTIKGTLSIDQVLKTEEVRKEENRKKIEMVNEKLRMFYYNDYFAATLILQLLGSDLAYYKNYRDFIKRNKQVYACGEKIFSRTTDDLGNITGKLTEKAIYLEDENVIATSYGKLKQMLEESDISELDKAQIRFILSKYLKICATDGQSLRSLSSLRKILIAKGGKWTKDMETAFEHIRKGDVLTALDFKAFWNSVKPFYFGNETLKVNGRTEKIVTQHKNSEYVITALYSVLNTALQQSPKLRGLQRFMEENDIDVVHFHSAVKVGYNTPFSLNYNAEAYNRDLDAGKVELLGRSFTGTYEEYYKTLKQALIEGFIDQEYFDEHYNRYLYQTELDVADSLTSQLNYYNSTLGVGNAVKEFSLDNYMFVLPSDDHLIDLEAIFGTQLKNIIMADLSNTFEIDVNIGGELVHLNRELAILFYNTLLVDNLLDAFKSLSSEFKDIHSLQQLLFRNMEGNDRYGKDVWDALQIDEKTQTFVLPFNSPTLSNKIEALILSTFKNEILRLKISGGSAVLVSNFGLDNKLHVVYDEGHEGERSHVKYIEAYLPAAHSDLYKDFLKPEGSVYKIDFAKMREKLGPKADELLNIIGYRIPTEDKYSILPIKVVGFMPVSVGTTVMLPAEIISMSGTDFDIDKLFLMLKDYTRYKYKQNLGNKYEKYLRSLHISFDDSIAYRTLKRREHSKGYTERTIASLRDKDEYFDEFMEDNESDLMYETPQYDFNTLRTKDKEGNPLSLDEMSKQSNKRDRNNTLIDIIYKTLTSPEGSRINMLVGNFENLELASRQLRLLKNPEALRALRENFGKNADINDFDYYKAISKMTKEELESFMEEYAEPDDPNDIMFFADTHRNLMDGNSLIGIFAVNSSDHYKLQNCDILIKPEYQFTLDGTVVNKIDTVNSLFNGNLRTGSICAEYQAAAPDNGKNPCLGDVGANENTTKTIGFLARIGQECVKTAVLNNSEDLVAYIKKLLKSSKFSNIKADSSFNINTSDVANWCARFREDPEAFNLYVQNPANTTIKMQLVLFYYMMLKIYTLGRTLNSVTAISRSDSVNGALKVSIPEVIQQEKAIRNFAESAKISDCPITGLDLIVDDTLGSSEDISNLDMLRDRVLKSPIPRLLAAYTFGIEGAKALIGKYLPALNDTTRLGVDYLCYAAKRPMTSKKYTTLWRKYVAELTLAIMSLSELFGDDSNLSEMAKRNYYIHDFPMKFREMRDSVNEDGTPKYPEIANLTIIKYLSNRSEKGIKFTNLSGTNDRTRLMYTLELELLLTSKNPEVNRFALDLFMYSYYDNGFAFSHSNFSILFTTLFFKNMPGIVETLNNYDSNNHYFDIENYTRQFLINHPELIPAVDDRKGAFSEDLSTFTVDNKEELAFSGRTLELVLAKKKLGEAKVMNIYKYLPLISTSNGIYYRDGVNSVYKRLDFDPYTLEVPYYDMSKEIQDIEWEKLEKRGIVAGLLATLTLEEKNKKEAEKAAEESSEEDSSIDNADDNESLEDTSIDNATDEELEELEDSSINDINDEEEYEEDPSINDINEEDTENLEDPSIDLADDYFEDSSIDQADDDLELIENYKETEDNDNNICHN